MAKKMFIYCVINLVNNKRLKSKQMSILCNLPENQLKNSVRQGSKPFKVIRISDGVILGTWVNKNECARCLGLDRRKISACLKGYYGRKSHKGCRFELC